MKKLGVLLVAATVTVFVSCKNEKKDMENMDGLNDTIQIDSTDIKEAPKTLTIAMASKSGSTAQGEVYFSEENGTVKMEAKIIGLKPGTHAIHLHEKADCSTEDATSAGGHWNPTMQPHGKWGDAAGYHKGDIGNFEVGDDGVGKISMETNEWCIGCGDENKDIIGKSVIVHAGKDDFKTQPTGDAGGRVSCGGIIK
jgi:Cu-Zn family superoxide dismutase